MGGTWLDHGGKLLPCGEIPEGAKALLSHDEVQRRSRETQEGRSGLCMDHVREGGVMRGKGRKEGLRLDDGSVQ